MDYLDAIGRENISARPGTRELCLRKARRAEKHSLFGRTHPSPSEEGTEQGRAGLVSFLLADVHAHDVVTLADQAGVALRADITARNAHAPARVESTAARSFIFTTPRRRWIGFVEVVKEIQKFFAQ